MFADQTWTQLAAANARSDRFMQTVMQHLDDSSLEITRLANAWQASSAPTAPQRTQQVPTVTSSPTIAVAAPLSNNLFATSANGDISLIANTDLTHNNLSRTSTLNTSLVAASHEDTPHIISLLPLRPDSSVHRSQPLQLKPFDPKGNFQTWRNNAEFQMKHEGYTQQDIFNKLAMCIPADRNDLRSEHTTLVSSQDFRSRPITERYDLIMASFSQACLRTMATTPANATAAYAHQNIKRNYPGIQRPLSR